MRHIRQSRHCRRIFFRYLRQRDKEKEAEKNLSAQSQVAPNEEPTDNPPPRKISQWAIVATVCIIALIITLIVVNAVSCSNKKKITLDDGRVSDYSWSQQVNFYTTAHRIDDEESQTFYVRLYVYDENNTNIYLLQRAFTFEKYKYTEPISFEVDKWLIENYQSFNFAIEKKWDYNIDTPQDHHIFQETVTTPATCLSSGIKKTTCSHCSISKTETIPALGHNWVGTVCTNCNLKMKTYRLIISETIVSNNHVGNSWSQVYKYNNEQIGRTVTITAPPDSTIIISATITEHDEYPDVGHSSIKVVLTDGKTSSGTVAVQENRGKYARNKAKWSIIISVEEIK